MMGGAECGGNYLLGRECPPPSSGPGINVIRSSIIFEADPLGVGRPTLHKHNTRSVLLPTAPDCPLVFVTENFTPGTIHTVGLNSLHAPIQLGGGGGLHMGDLGAE